MILQEYLLSFILDKSKLNFQKNTLKKQGRSVITECPFFLLYKVIFILIKNNLVTNHH